MIPLFVWTLLLTNSAVLCDENSLFRVLAFGDSLTRGVVVTMVDRTKKYTYHPYTTLLQRLFHEQLHLNATVS